MLKDSHVHARVLWISSQVLLWQRTNKDDRLKALAPKGFQGGFCYVLTKKHGGAFVEIHIIVMNEKVTIAKY